MMLFTTNLGQYTRYACKKEIPMEIELTVICLPSKISIKYICSENTIRPIIHSFTCRFKLKALLCLRLRDPLKRPDYNIIHIAIHI